MGFFEQKITHALTKICSKMAKINVNRRKLLARAALGQPLTFFLAKETPSLVV